MLPCLFWGRCQIPRLGVSCSSGAAFRVCFVFAFFGGDAKSLAWLFLARRVLTKWMVMGSVYLENCLKQSPVASLCALLSLTCYGPPFCSPKMSKICQDFRCVAKCCLAFFGGRCQIPRLGVSCSSGAAFRVFFFCLFWGRCQIPRLGVSCSSGAAFRVWVQHDRVYRDMKQQKLDKDSILAVSCHAASSLAKCCLY